MVPRYSARRLLPAIGGRRARSARAWRLWTLWTKRRRRAAR